MNADAALAEEFEGHRAHLRRVAYRMLGSIGEADDAVQEAWLRLHAADGGSIDNLGGWLTTVVARICLDALRARRTRREDGLDGEDGAPPVDAAEAESPEDDVARADALGPALLVVLDTLGPGERVAFVLHDLFDLPFEPIATVLGRSAAATRQLATRARRRVQGAAPAAAVDLERRRAVVTAFLAASRDGRFDDLLTLLDGDARLRADPTAVRAAAAAAGRGAPILERAYRGAEVVATALSGRARGARLALVDGAPGAAWELRGTIRAVFAFRFEGERIVGIDIVMEHVGEFDVQLLDG
jgi:RNA polymerase sigma factor (sigma-70 family)